MATAVQVESIWNGLTDNSGQPLAAGKVYTYSAGTTTPVSLYTSSDKSTSATNPLILDGNGKAQVWADGRYKFVVKTSADVTLYTLDNLLYGFDDTTVLLGGISTGSANAQVVSVPATVESYANGQRITFIAGYTNSGAVTLQFNSLAPVSIVKGPTSSSLQAGDLIAGQLYSCTYYGGSFRLENVPTPADVQRSRAQIIASVIGTNTITGTLTPALTGYETGEVFRFKAANASTSAVTINIDGLGAKAIQYNNAALVAGEIAANVWHEIVYDGTQFQLLNPVNVSSPLWGGTTAGTSTAYTITPAPAITAYAAGQRFTFKAHVANGAAATIAVSGLTAKTLQRQGLALVGNEVVANDLVSVVYDGTNFQILSVAQAPLFVDRANNRVGIGTTAPATVLDVQTTNTLIDVSTFDASTLSSEMRFKKSRGASVGTNTIVTSGDNLGIIRFAGANGSGYTDGAWIAGVVTGTPGASNDMPTSLLFATAADGSGTPTERMRIDNAGKVGVGGAAVGKFHAFATTDDDTVYVESSGNRPTVRYLRSGTSYATTFVDGGGFTSGSNNSYSCRAGATGGVYLAQGGTAWVAISDARFKKNIKELEYGLDEVKQLNPVRFDYIEDTSEESCRIGFLAQEVKTLIPEAVQGTEAIKLGLSTTELIPALVNAIKELNAKVVALEARIATLEA